jgi:hypothetical protein
MQTSQAAATESSSTTKSVQLYGGALQVKLPESMRDISQFVPVPDHQEVYQDMSKGEGGVTNLGQVIFELVDVAEVADDKVMKHCFNDLSEDNHSKETIVISEQVMPDLLHESLAQSFNSSGTCVAKLIGTQRIAPNKRPGEALKHILIQLAIIRIKKH